MNETPATIRAWAQETFPDNGKNPLASAARMNIEMAELVHAVAVGDLKGIAEEAADVFIMAMGFCPEGTQPYFWGAPAASAGAVADFAEKANYHMLHILQELRRVSSVDRVVILHHIREMCWALDSAACLLKFSIWAQVERKMQINRGRRWEQTSPGRFQHKGD